MASSNPKSVLSASEAGEQWAVTDGETCDVLDENGQPVAAMQWLARPVAIIYRDAVNASLSSLRQRLKEGGAWNCSQLELQYALSLEETRILRQRLGEAERKLKELGEKL